MLKAKVRIPDNRVVAASEDSSSPAIKPETGFVIVDPPGNGGIFGANPERRYNGATGTFEPNPAYVPEVQAPPADGESLE